MNLSSFRDPIAFLALVSTLGEVVGFLVLGRQFLNFRPSGTDELVIFL